MPLETQISYDQVSDQEASKGSKVSVVIPCFNQAHYLSEAIESVLRQSYRHFEIIVVDDGSPDNASEVAGRYPEVRCIRRQNGGISAARNTGLSASKGEFILFLDSDDRLLPEALEIGVRNLKDHPNCAFVWGQCRHIDSDGKLISSRSKPRIEKDFYLTLLTTNYIRTPGVVMYRRDVFKHVGEFNTSLRGPEDYDMHLRITRSFPVFCHDQYVAEYRIHGNSAMHNSARMLKDTLTALRLQREFVRVHKEYADAYEQGKKEWKQLFGDRLWKECVSNLKTPRTTSGQALKALWALVFYDHEWFRRRLLSRWNRRGLGKNIYSR
jgi:glycosyltransferase involved in cell wall biosynthesis